MSCTYFTTLPSHKAKTMSRKQPQIYRNKKPYICSSCGAIDPTGEHRHDCPCCFRRGSMIKYK